MWAVDAIVGGSVRDRLVEITAPARIVTAAHNYTPVSVRKQMGAEMPNARLAVVPGTRHPFPVNALPDTFLEEAEASDRADAQCT